MNGKENVFTAEYINYGNLEQRAYKCPHCMSNILHL